MDAFVGVITIVVYAIEGLGVAIIVVGAGVSTTRFLARWRQGSPETNYLEYRRAAGRSIILGLEFLIAGDVIRTVVVSHTVTDIAELAMIVLIRAFLSFTLAIEIEGRLPWKEPPADKGG